MILRTMLVLKLHEVSLYIFITGLISTIILHSLFFSLFALMNSQSCFTLHSFAVLSYFVCQVIALLFYLYFFSQSCYNTFSGTVFL